ncbi:MAG: hypothetical protein IAG13_15835 [Deltaproteobacteria bacterium]|nr:hypothetical protein [Nannocystaceae bacterium]
MSRCNYLDSDRFCGLLTERVPWPGPGELAVWWQRVGLRLSSTWSFGRGEKVGSGRLEPGLYRAGGESEAFLSGPHPIERLDIEGDIEHELDILWHERRNGQKVDLSRQVELAALGMDPLGAFELQIERQRVDEFDESNHDATDPDDQTREEPTPGSVVRCVYVRAGAGHYVRIRLTVEDRSQHSLEKFWGEACARLWVGASGRS